MTTVVVSSSSSKVWRLLGRHYGIACVRLRDRPDRSAATVALERDFDGDTAAVGGVPALTNGTAFQPA